MDSLVGRDLLFFERLGCIISQKACLLHMAITELGITELGIQHSNKLTGTQSVSAGHGGNVLKPYSALGGDGKSP